MKLLSLLSNRPVSALLLAALVLASSGCFGLPPGSADVGDTVSLRYTAVDLASGLVLRENRTATFVVGSGESGLGLSFERALRGHAANDTFEATVRDDPTLDFSATVEVDRALPAIPVHQDAPRADFDGSQFGPATVGKTFPAYGIYEGVVTGVNETTVTFDVHAQDGQEDPVPSVGCTLLTHVSGDQITRELVPVVGSVFGIQPPSAFQPRTPLGLEAGSYKVLGATATKVQFGHSASTQTDLLGKDLTYTVTLLRVTPGEHTVGPVDGNYGERASPQVNGDPHSVVLGTSATGSSDDHAH